MIKKISLPVLITLMCVVLFGVGVLYYFNLQNKKKTTVSTEPKISRTDYSAVARKTLDWIDQQRNEDGWYILERGCDYEKKTCDVVWDNDEGNKDGLIATWARFNFYQQTKDPKDLEIVKNDINKFYEKYPNGVDNALWICKITYDMWKSDLFEQGTKDKLEKICFESKFLNPDDFQKYLLNDRNLLIQKLSKIDSWSSWSKYTLSLRGFDSVYAYPTEFIIRYRWKKDLIDLELAKKYTEIIKTLLEKKNEYLIVTYPEDKCLAFLSLLDYYELSYDEDGLFFVNDFFDNNFIGENEKNYLTPICGSLYKRMYKKFSDNKFLNRLEVNNKYLLKISLDGGLTSLKGDSSFFKSDNKNRSVYFKNIIGNSLIVETCLISKHYIVFTYIGCVLSVYISL